MVLRIASAVVFVTVPKCVVQWVVNGRVFKVVQGAIVVNGFKDAFGEDSAQIVRDDGPLTVVQEAEGDGWKEEGLVVDHLEISNKRSRDIWYFKFRLRDNSGNFPNS